MTIHVAEQIMALSADDLTSIVRQIVGGDAVAKGDVQTAKIGRSMGTATAGIYRVTGRAKTNQSEQPWSAVVKALGVPETKRAWLQGDGLHEGLRELDVYRAGAFVETEGGLRTPRCYRIQSLPALELLWIEDLSDATQPPWSPELFVECARHLGRFNAQWPASSLPDWPWLSRQGFRASFTGNRSRRQAFERLPEIVDDPIIQKYAPGDGVNELLQLWARCDELLQLAEATDMGVCHLDCHPRNLFPMAEQNGSGYTIGIDWTEVGLSNLGIDLGHLLASPLSFFDLSLQSAWALRDPMFDAYLAGLHDAGWTGDERGVRLTYLTRIACEALRAAGGIVSVPGNKQWIESLESRADHPITEIAEHWRESRALSIDCMEEALLSAERLS